MNRPAVVQPLKVTWKFSNGHAKTAALGMKKRALRQTTGGIMKFSNGHARTAVRENDAGSRGDAARYPENLGGGGGVKTAFYRVVEIVEMSLQRAYILLSFQ